MKLSIITPSFNQGRFIERTIQSVLQQNIADLEYFVVDGGSDDETVAILEHYVHSLTYVSEPDRGQAHAVNKGLLRATGDIIGWLNSDDIYYPNVFQTILHYFKQHPEIDVVYGDAFHIDENDKIIERYPTEPFTIQRLKSTCYLSQPTVFFRRNCIDRFGRLDESLHFCMDYEYWLRLALKDAKFAYVPEIFAGSRLYPQTKTMSSPLKATYETLQMLKKHLQVVPTQWLINYAVCKTKQTTSYRFPDPRFMIVMCQTSLREVFQLNGFFNGLRSFLSLPYQLIKSKFF